MCMRKDGWCEDLHLLFFPFPFSALSLTMMLLHCLRSVANDSLKSVSR